MASSAGRLGQQTQARAGQPEERGWEASRHGPMSLPGRCLLRSQQHHCPLSGPHGRSADPPPPSRGDTIATPTPRLWKPRLGNQGCRLPLCTDRGGAVHTVVYISGFPGVGSEQPEQLYLMTTQGRRWDWPLEPVALRLVPSPPGRPMGIKGPGSRRSKGGGPFPKRLDSMTSDMSSIDRCSNYWAPTECQALWRESGLRW